MVAGELQSCLDVNVETASPETPLAEVVHRMERSGRSAIIVTDPEQHPIGIITERDILCIHARSLRGEDLSGMTAGDLMTPQPMTLPVEDSLYEALVISQNHRIRHLPVVDAEGRLIGMVTHPGLVNAHLRLIDEQARLLEEAVARETEDLSRANRELLTLSMTDALLGIGNRRAMEVDLKHTLTLAQAHHKALTVMLIDVDHFKQYNDRHGHPAGDQALKQVAERIQAVIRNADRLYRYGGEEFLLLLPGCDGAQAQHVGRRILDAFARAPLPHEASPIGRISVSIGIASLPGVAEKEELLSMEEFIEAADRWLYEAKASGRDCMRGPEGRMQAA